MLVPSDARDQLAQSVQNREEPMVPEIAVHTFDSHRVQATNKQLVVKRACKRREFDAVQNRQLPVQSLTAFIKQTKTLSVTAVSKHKLADQGDVCRHSTRLRKMNSKEGTMRLRMK